MSLAEKFRGAASKAVGKMIPPYHEADFSSTEAINAWLKIATPENVFDEMIVFYTNQLEARNTAMLERDQATIHLIQIQLDTIEGIELLLKNMFAKDKENQDQINALKQKIEELKIQVVQGLYTINAFQKALQASQGSQASLQLTA